MKKKAKGIVGLCLVAALAVGGVGTYAQAGTEYIKVRDSYDVQHVVECSSSVGQTSGSAYSAAVGSSYCHCSVSATFVWKDSSGATIDSNGGGAGGMHGASVTLQFVGQSDFVYSSDAQATHTVRVTSGGDGYQNTTAHWLR